MRHELVCTEAATPPRLALRSVARPRPGADELLVRVQASAVNPIDAKRAAGYGCRLLALKGAARFPQVLGNDFAGVVEALGPGVSGFEPGQSVFGLVATGRGGGAHASHLVVPRHQMLAAPDDAEPASLAVLPYSFTTMWLALRAAGLDAGVARGARVLVHGAGGGLGWLALQQLSHWGCDITAIGRAHQRAQLLVLGAREVVEHGPGAIEALPADFDAVLNFADWGDDARLAGRLGPRALGHATTVHPLLANFDRLGWWGGARATWRDRRRVAAIARARAPQARYAWTVFRPDAEALAVLGEGVRARRLTLPVGTAQPFANAIAAFQHVSAGQPGRAVLLP